MKMTWLHMEFVLPKPSQIGQNGSAAAADARLAGPRQGKTKTTIIVLEVATKQILQIQRSNILPDSLME